MNEVCGKCALCGGCLTGDSVRLFAEKLKKGRSVSGSEISRALGKKCLREDELAGEINRGYGYYLASRSAYSRISAIRSVINGQLGGVGMMLAGLSGELVRDFTQDDYSARMVCKGLAARGYEDVRCACRIEPCGRRVLSLTVRSRDDESDAEDIAECAGECLGLDFGADRADNAGDMLDIVLTQRPAYALECVFEQHCCGGGSYCGDSCDSFGDGGSRGYMLLSDGMGSGGRADHEFKTTLKMTCLDRKGLLADVTMQLSMMHISISMLNSREMKDGNAVITATISVSSKEHLAQITSKLSRIDGVLTIE